MSCYVLLTYVHHQDQNNRQQQLTRSEQNGIHDRVDVTSVILVPRMRSSGRRFRSPYSIQLVSEWDKCHVFTMLIISDLSFSSIFSRCIAAKPPQNAQVMVIGTVPHVLHSSIMAEMTFLHIHMRHGYASHIIRTVSSIQENRNCLIEIVINKGKTKSSLLL